MIGSKILFAYRTSVNKPTGNLSFNVKKEEKSDSLIYILYFRKLPLLFLFYSVFLPPTPRGLQRRTYQSYIINKFFTKTGVSPLLILKKYHTHACFYFFITLLPIIKSIKRITISIFFLKITKIVYKIS